MARVFADFPEAHSKGEIVELNRNFTFECNVPSHYNRDSNQWHLEIFVDFLSGNALRA